MGSGFLGSTGSKAYAFLFAFVLILIPFLSVPAIARPGSPEVLSKASEIPLNGLKFTGQKIQSTQAQFTIPEKTLSAQVEIKGLPDRLYIVDSLEGPNSKPLVVNHLDQLPPQNLPQELSSLDAALAHLYGEEGGYSALPQYLSPIRSEPGIEPGTATLLLVAPPGKTLSAGNYQLRVRQISVSPSPHTLEGRVLLKSAGRHSKSLKLLFVLTGVRGWKRNHRDLSLFVDYLKPILQQADLVVKPSFLELDLQDFHNLDTAEQMNSLFSQFESHKKGQNRGVDDRFLPVFLVNRFDLIGNVSYSPGIPGPCSSLFKGVGVIASIGETNLSLAEHATTLAHEIGHFLGLRHIYESTSRFLVDDLEDTPARAEIKPNEYWLMDPRPSVRGGVIPRLSPRQSEILKAHWLVH